MKLIKKLIFGCAASLGLTCLSTVPALACYRSYGTAQWFDTPKNQGAFAQLYISSGSVSDLSTGGHINQTLWEGASGATSTQNWVEAGYTYGYHSSNVLTWYWAQRNPKWGYGDHRITSITPSVGTWVPIQIEYGGVNAGGNPYWNILIDKSSQSGPDGTTVAVGNTSPSYSMQVGLESTCETNKLSTAYVNSLYYKDQYGTWTSKWQNSSLYQSPPATVKWTTQYSAIEVAQ